MKRAFITYLISGILIIGFAVCAVSNMPYLAVFLLVIGGIVLGLAQYIESESRNKPHVF